MGVSFIFVEVRVGLDFSFGYGHAIFGVQNFANSINYACANMAGRRVMQQ